MAHNSNSPHTLARSTQQDQEPALESSKASGRAVEPEHTGTYSPEDNKLRLYPSARLDAQTYQRVRAAGFSWAPRQKLFVAPMWTPGRADLLAELCGDIGDEDTTLGDRAEERAERFDGYSAARSSDAEASRRAVEAITDGIPLGQPILIGHHSERRARKDAERIHNGMRKAVRMWETAAYWEQRARAASFHAEYKQLPTVRARRIKGLEADQRKRQRVITLSEGAMKLWQADGLTFEHALAIANHGHVSCCFPLASFPRNPPASQYEGTMSLYSALDGRVIDAQQARDIAVRAYTGSIDRSRRWLAHIELRLGYERAMLGEQGAADLLKPKPKKVQLPLCNYPAPDGLRIENTYHRGEFSTYPQVEMTKAEYARIYTDYKGTRVVQGSHRVRAASIQSRLVCVFLTDTKVHEPPAPAGPEPPTPIPAPLFAPLGADTIPRPSAALAAANAMREQLRAGVRVAVVPQLFPTPADIAQQLIERADIRPGHSVLEPSAGTAALLRALPCVRPSGHVTAVELSSALIADIEPWADEVVKGDFLQQSPATLGLFDRIVMNPPFGNAQDIAHILHARTFLAPAGRLVALCADGPRQSAALRPIVQQCGGTWEELPPGAFASQGTGVRVAMLSLPALSAE